MLVVHGTRLFRDRVPGAPIEATDRSTTQLGSWYAGLLRWRPAVALFVNKVTLLPVVVRVAPARTLLPRFPGAVAEILEAHDVPRQFIDREVTEMGEIRLAPTANRSVVGMINEFGYLAGASRADVASDLVDLSVRLAATPCSPLYRRHVSPDRELAAFVSDQITP